MSVKRKSSGQIVVLKDGKALQEKAEVPELTARKQADAAFADKLLETPRGILGRFLPPSDVEKEVKAFQSELVQKQARSRLAIFQQCRDFQEKSLNKLLNAVYSTTSTDIDAETTDHKTKKEMELREALMQRSMQFSKTCEDYLRAAAEIESNKIRELQEQFIIGCIEKYTENIHRLLDEFSENLHERI